MPIMIGKNQHTNGIVNKGFKLYAIVCSPLQFFIYFDRKLPAIPCGR
jgi:hypothetical protein